MQYAGLENMSTQSQRLKEARERAGLSQKQVAEAVGMKQPSYSYLEKTDGSGSAKITEIAKVLNVDPYWLRTGKGAPNADAHLKVLLENSPNPLFNEVNNDKGVWVDLVNVRFSCGIGESIEFHYDEVKKRIRFDPDFFKQYNVKPENIKLVEAVGDSQEPYVRSGDMFAIDTADVDIRDGEFYAVYFEGEAMLKRIIKEPGGVLVLNCLNNRYKDKVITPENGSSFRVIGRQFWRAG